MRFLRSLALIFLCLLPSELPGAEQEPPNFIVIFTDDHGWPDLGAAGVYDDLKTPNLDALADSGVRATSGYVSAPQCVPSRAGLLTGKSQNRFGVESNGMPLGGFDAEQTIAERLKMAGYAAGQVGKWHLGPTNLITAHGFDDVYSKNANRPCHANFTLDGQSIPMQTVDDGLYHLDACNRAAVTFIRRHRERPFFLYLAYRAPHVPLDAPEKYLSRFPGKMPERRRQALAMISAMDDGVGEIVNVLRTHGLHERTCIFFIGDNGAPLKIHKIDAPGGGPGWDGSLNEPLNGEKGMLSEGGIRVPFLVSWPGTLPAGLTYPHPLSSLDVAATVQALAGLPEDPTLDGVNVVPWLTGEREGAPHDFLAWRWIAQSAIRSGPWKLLRAGEREYLYDLESDPAERENLLENHPEVARRLRAKLTDWAAGMQPPGLATKPMSETWESYFDHYHDGKPAAPPRREPAPPGARSFAGWIARGATLARSGEALAVTPERATRNKSPFLVQSGLAWEGPFTASVTLKANTAGAVGVAWRADGQKDFPRDQVARVALEPSEDWQEVRVEVPARGRTIHLRLHLPPGRSEVRDVILSHEERRQAWTRLGTR